MSLTRRRVRNETWVVGPCRGTRPAYPSPALRRPRGRARGPRAPPRSARRASRSSARPPTAPRASRRRSSSGPTSCSWTSRCRASTGSPRRAGSWPRGARRARGGAHLVRLTTRASTTPSTPARSATCSRTRRQGGRARRSARRRAASRRSTRASPGPCWRADDAAALCGLTRARARGPRAARHGPAEQGDRAPSGDQRGDGEGPPHAGLPADRRDRSHPGRDLGPRASPRDVAAVPAARRVR